ncbi:TIGR04222 domain-containing membrane protein [Kitasatospora purpeofusca]|uniref:TIGR04222 domain-containing membrane protein n=1 Tax=Kitasatospora purpeofusca TaxID=67352 RepID=UPI0036BAB22F
MVGLLCAGLLRWLPLRGRAEGLPPAGVAAVRGGSKAALAVVVVELHLAGVLDVDRHGRLKRVVHGSPGRDGTPLHRAARSAFGRALSWADAAAAPAVRRACEEVRVDLVGRGLRCGRVRLVTAGLTALAAGVVALVAAAQGAAPTGVPVAVVALGVLLAPVRTLAGRRLLRDLRRRHPAPGATGAGAVGPEEAGLLTALYGRRALRRLLPDFAAASGLLGGRAGRETVARSGGGPYEGSSALS